MKDRLEQAVGDAHNFLKEVFTTQSEAATCTFNALKNSAGRRKPGDKNGCKKNHKKSTGKKSRCKESTGS
jgi:hypothetical protein